MKDNEELIIKSCKFCKGKDLTIGQVFQATIINDKESEDLKTAVICNTCGAQGPGTMDTKTPMRISIELWNKAHD